jgi:hypothetical protein
MIPTSKKNETMIELKEMVDRWIQSNCIISEIKEIWKFPISPKKSLIIKNLAKFESY